MTMERASEAAFESFMVFCTELMDLRKREVLAERRIIDTTTWPLEESDKRGEVVTTTPTMQMYQNGANPFEAFELEISEAPENETNQELTDSVSPMTQIVTLHEVHTASPVVRPHGHLHKLSVGSNSNRDNKEQQHMSLE